MKKVGGIVFYLGIAISFFLFVPAWYVRCRLRNRQSEFYNVGAWYFHWWLPLLGIAPKVEGLENIPSGTFVVLSNHQSFVDIGTIMSAVRPVAFLAKKELFRVPFFGPALHYTGSIPVDRENPRNNKGIPSLIRQRLSEGFRYCVFPEGTRSADGALLPFKSGIFRMIREAPVPVLPVTLDGTGRAVPKRGIALVRTTPRLVVHPVISPEEIASMSVEEFRDRVRTVVASGFSTHAP